MYIYIIYYIYHLSVSLMILMAIWWQLELQIAPRLVSEISWTEWSSLGSMNPPSLRIGLWFVVTQFLLNQNTVSGWLRRWSLLHYTKFKTCFVCLILLVFQYQSRSFEVAWELSSHCQSVVPSDGWAIHWLKQKIWSQWPRVTIKLHRRDRCICSKCALCHCAFQTHTWTTSKINAKRRRNRT